MIDVGSQIARALSAAHAAGIAHRDVKPENVMIRADGFVKVLDFGLALHTEDTLDLTTRTHSTMLPGTFTGTPSYMSPESVNGDMVGTAGDIFALGVVLYEMAAGRRPFQGLTPASVIASIVADQPLPPGRLNPAIPPVFDELVLQMLRKDPTLRPTARDVERALTAAGAGSGTGRLPCPPPSGGRPLGGNRSARG